MNSVAGEEENCPPRPNDHFMTYNPLPFEDNFILKRTLSITLQSPLTDRNTTPIPRRHRGIKLELIALFTVLFEGTSEELWGGLID